MMEVRQTAIHHPNGAAKPCLSQAVVKKPKIELLTESEAAWQTSLVMSVLPSIVVVALAQQSIFLGSILALCLTPLVGAGCIAVVLIHCGHGRSLALSCLQATIAFNDARMIQAALWFAQTTGVSAQDLVSTRALLVAVRRRAASGVVPGWDAERASRVFGEATAKPTQGKDCLGATLPSAESPSPPAAPADDANVNAAILGNKADHMTDDSMFGCIADTRTTSSASPSPAMGNQEEPDVWSKPSWVEGCGVEHTEDGLEIAVEPDEPEGLAAAIQRAMNTSLFDERV
jgi:hypothetical protein